MFLESYRNCDGKAFCSIVRKTKEPVCSHFEFDSLANLHELVPTFDAFNKDLQNYFTSNVQLKNSCNVPG
jgi:hypothetical protein